MGKALKVVLIVIGFIALSAGGLVSYLLLALPDVGPPPSIKIKPTPELVDRGRYLANHVLVCIDCHSVRDWSKFSGPIKPGTVGRGGDVFDEKLGFPGRFVARNITPYSMAKWSDGELYRVITTGVAKNGEPLFPVMPYLAYGRLAERDVRAVIAYIRTLRSVTHDAALSKANFPMNLIMRTIPKKAAPMKPVAGDTLEYGRYLVTVAACGDCHTRAERGEPIPGLEFAGGFEFKFPGGSIVRSANITPHNTTGIGKWSADKFIGMFKKHPLAGKTEAESPYQTVMPWSMYAGLTRRDLSAMYKYLKSIKAVEHQVQHWSPAKK